MTIRDHTSSPLPTYETLVGMGVGKQIGDIPTSPGHSHSPQPWLYKPGCRWGGVEKKERERERKRDSVMMIIDDSKFTPLTPYPTLVIGPTTYVWHAMGGGNVKGMALALVSDGPIAIVYRTTYSRRR